ncbi:Ivy family c-type lysozyme inhibitor [Advenella mimigardefordensis]|uniref:Ivy family c-type lysozyme inhibitor n=1 Tax=Advenella mimigardefordensis TaxID=302406 RepID=UPI00046CB140|nr:Ivy family c-type lysozyme inhibitor [Advenella mimigardefordensis]
MRHFIFKSLVLATWGSLAFAGQIYAADLYPADLANQEPQAANAFAGLTKALVSKHAWVKNYGVTIPVEDTTLGSESYWRLSGCKPHDCPSEKYVVLISKKNNHAVGAFLTNQLAATGNVSDSTIQWLGQPTDEQVAELATALFPAPDN